MNIKNVILQIYIEKNVWVKKSVRKKMNSDSTTDFDVIILFI